MEEGQRTVGADTLISGFAHSVSLMKEGFRISLHHFLEGMIFSTGLPWPFNFCCNRSIHIFVSSEKGLG